MPVIAASAGAPVGENPPVPPDVEEGPEHPGPGESPPGYDPRPDPGEGGPERPAEPEPSGDDENAEERQRQGR